MNRIYLITGGVRSGKSKLGLVMAEKAEKPHFIATAEAGDDEMKKRIINHKNERSYKWITIEEKYDIGDAVNNAVRNGADLIVVDCITLWLTNLMLAEKDVNKSLEYFKNALKKTVSDVILVTNEVGLGVVPESKLGRDYRDELGRVNQILAEFATDVIFMVSGIPMKIK